MAQEPAAAEALGIAAVVDAGRWAGCWQTAAEAKAGMGLVAAGYWDRRMGRVQVRTEAQKTARESLGVRPPSCACVAAGDDRSWAAAAFLVWPQSYVKAALWPVWEYR